jgi:hypothetical protein
VRKLGVIATVAMTLMLAACTSTTSPAVTKAANIAKAAAAAALKAETAAKAAATAAEKAAATAKAAEIASAQPCTASQLTEPGLSGVASGHVAEVVSLRNTSSKTCTLKGYPSLKMLDASGKPMPTVLTDGSDGWIPSVPEHLVIVTARSEASFELGFTDETGGTAICPASSQVEVTPPDADQPITLRWRIASYGGTVAKPQCGHFAVSALYARGDASAQ